MIEVKHFLDEVGPGDGCRIWIEPVGLTRDLREWCQVDCVLSHVGPPPALRGWFVDHPDQYDEFRGLYHEYLEHGPYKARLHRLALAATSSADCLTLLHDEDNPGQNAATALAEFLAELAHWPIQEM